MSTTKKSQEKRQHPRQDIVLDAVLSVGDTPVIECQIIDFSHQGMFLKFKTPANSPIHKNKIARLYFSAIIDSSKDYYQIDAQVARVVDEGVGITFENLSDSMYRALIQTAKEGGALSGFSKNPRFTFSSWGHHRFTGAFTELLNNFLPLMIGDFFNAAEDALEKPPEFAENFKDIVAQGNVMSVLRMNKNSLLKKYCAAIISDIDFTSDKFEQKKASLNISNANLSLIEKDEFETLLNYSAVVRKINAEFKNQLYQLELKLSYVTCFPRFLINNPISPERLCDCFRNEIANIENSSAVQKTLYKVFQSILAKHLGGLYHALDDLLVEYGAPAGIAQDIVWKKNYPGSTSPKDSGSSTYKHEPSQSLPSFDSDAFYYDESHAHHAAPEPQIRQRQYQQPLSETATKLLNLINKSLPDIGGSSVTGGQALPQQTAGSNAEFSVDELLSALTKLQVSNVTQQLSTNSTSLLQSQLENSTQASDYLGAKNLSPEDKTKLDVYDQLYQALSNEVTLSPGIKPYVEDIKLPLMGLALQDHNFLDSPAHPARNLLNQLYNVESAVNQNKIIKNTKVRQILDQIVTNISQNSINNPDVFAKANEELKEISGPIVRSRDLNIRRVVEVLEGKQKLELARHNIQREIDQRIAGKTIPSTILSLLESGWQHIMLMAELDGNLSAKERYFETLDALLIWYRDLQKLPDGQKEVIQQELNFINATLETVSTNAFVLSKVMEDLNDTLMDAGSPRAPKSIEMVFVEPRTETGGKSAKTDVWHLQVDQFEAGDWFTFSLEKEAFEPLKLIWKGELPPVFVFVNRDGYKKQELTRDQLAEYLQTGVATKIENLDEPLMDRATASMLQKMQEKVIHSVSHDPLTNLPNRRRFMSIVKEELYGATYSSPVLGILEIEDFRIITNVCGVVGGDQLLFETAKTISKQLGNDAIVSRMGDKTFGIFIRNGADDDGYSIAKNLRDLINKTNFIWEDKSYTVSVSIGLVPVLEGSNNIEELLQKADSVNISAQKSGHNRIRVYQENDETLRTQTYINEWAGRIDSIFAENRLFPRCQLIAPIFPEKNSHSHYEILLGIKDEKGNIIPPDNFIPAVEQCQRMPEIDRWIVENVFQWINQNPDSFAKVGGFAINLSGQSLNSEDFLNYLKERLAVNDVPASKITFEVTETVAAGSLVFTKRFIKEIKQFGCSFSLDDFGSGYSSYSYLKSLDVDYLKIDGSFVKDIVNSPTDQVMVNSMNEIAHSLEMETIAEYVENLKIQAVLREIGVDYAQGWGIQKPIPLADLANTLGD
jgi:diguanylate cyclase (GGDEF)-like protein